VAAAAPSPESLGEEAVAADGEALQIPEALGTAEDPKHGHQQEVLGRDAHPAPQPRIGDRLEEADQIETGCSRNAFGPKEEAIPPTSAHSDSPGN
jgi:hypothetical protein